jgi:molecular chaperone GrpE
MTNTRKRIPIDGQAAAAEASSAAAPPAPGAPPAPSAEPAAGDPTATADQADLAVEAQALRQERDGLAERELRLRAEFENFRRRASRELADERGRAQAELLHDLLPVLDNLERALDAAEHHDEGKVLGGVRMTRDLFVELLRRSGVEEVQTVGSPFDPHVHEAVVMQPSEQEEGVVTAVLQRGYRQGDRVMRAARVVVSSGPAEQASGSE